MADGPVWVSADEKLLSQALLNLVVNAQEAMPQGGALTLSTSVEKGWGQIRVADTGVGISESNRDRILRPFYSTKAKGTGLGLSITRRIIQEHSGDLSFSPNQGKGTVFSIHLPLSNSA